jgi:intergrase/recombinase
MSQFTLGKYIMNNKNPFIEKAINEINDNIVKKYKNATGTDKKAILQAFDPKTGEMLGHTTFVRQIEVDEDQFTKVYLSQFHSFFDLGTQGIRVFGYIMSKLIIGQDMFIFILNDVMEYTKYTSKSSVFIGIGQLLKAEIIARGPSDSLYYINPLVIFNGNRVTYARTYVKKQKESKLDPKQTSLFGQIE